VKVWGSIRNLLLLRLFSLENKAGMRFVEIKRKSRQGRDFIRANALKFY